MLGVVGKGYWLPREKKFFSLKKWRPKCHALGRKASIYTVASTTVLYHYELSPCKHAAQNAFHGFGYKLHGS